ncbi:MAG: NAD(P)-dependent oxidoreductase, partial [Candidatus Brocadiaceae bacterium]|nr:NAD(P)-dependent oxidoreductase [Candidatus Brocadiaceae bacterium]
SILKIAKEKEEVKIVNDQFASPTYTPDLAKQIQKLITTDAFGLYHATSEGGCSWYEFAKEVFCLTKTTVNLQPISSSQLNSLAKRPKYSVLENAKLNTLHLNIMRPWKNGLSDYLAERGKKLIP